MKAEKMAELSKNVNLGTSTTATSSPIDGPQKKINGLETGIDCTEIHQGDMMMAI